jgi:hypothetical protein
MIKSFCPKVWSSQQLTSLSLFRSPFLNFGFKWLHTFLSILFASKPGKIIKVGPMYMDYKDHKDLFSASRTEYPGFESRQDVRFLDLCTYIVVLL